MRRALPLFALLLIAACAERNKPEETPAPPAESAQNAAGPMGVTSVTSVPKPKISLKRLESARNLKVVAPPASIQGAPAATATPPADAATGG